MEAPLCHSRAVVSKFRLGASFGGWSLQSIGSGLFDPIPNYLDLDSQRRLLCMKIVHMEQGVKLLFLGPNWHYASSQEQCLGLSTSL